MNDNYIIASISEVKKKYENILTNLTKKSNELIIDVEKYSFPEFVNKIHEHRNNLRKCIMIIDFVNTDKFKFPRDLNLLKNSTELFEIELYNSIMSKEKLRILSNICSKPTTTATTTTTTSIVPVNTPTTTATTTTKPVTTTTTTTEPVITSTTEPVTTPVTTTKPVTTPTPVTTTTVAQIISKKRKISKSDNESESESDSSYETEEEEDLEDFVPSSKTFNPITITLPMDLSLSNNQIQKIIFGMECLDKKMKSSFVNHYFNMRANLKKYLNNPIFSHDNPNFIEYLNKFITKYASKITLRIFKKTNNGNYRIKKTWNCFKSDDISLDKFIDTVKQYSASHVLHPVPGDLLKINLTN